MTYLPKMVAAYLECALWSSHDDNGIPFDRFHTVSDVSDDAKERATRTCEDFMLRCMTWGDLLMGIAPDMAGHDLWLTQNGHGAGFWSRDLGPRGDKLTEFAHFYGERYVYKGDDGKLHLA